MYILSINMWFQKLMKQFFFGVDQVVYSFISKIYDLLMEIARTSILSQADILDMANRIYKLLAIFMIFKVTFSLITYVVNPDDFSDKNKGLSKLGTNIIISLCLLILTPYAFNYAYKFQTFILEDNSLATLIFGEKSETESGASFINTAGDKIAYVTMSGFLSPNTSIDKLQNCTTLLVNGQFNTECSGLDSETFESLGNTNSLYTLTQEDGKNFSLDTLKNYVVGVNYENFGLMFRQDLVTATTEKNSVFVMEYNYIFSTVVGVVIVLLLITFCMDIALRSIKLAFLQLVAPIPIISYADPKSGKDGLFKKWYQMCFKTYLSLFIRLIALYFAIYIIQLVADLKLVDIVDGSYKTGTLLSIFVIIGALMFAKQLPKILEGLGLKLDGGGFTLNPLKKLEKDALGGKGINKFTKAAAVAGTGAALVGGASLITGKGLKGTGTAMKKAVSGGLKGDKFGKNFSNSYSAGKAKYQQISKMKNDGVSSSQVFFENTRNKFTGMTRKDEYDDFSSTVKTIQDGYKNYYNGVIGGDKIAKMLEQRRVAAENRGDYQASTRLQDAIDARVKAVKDSGNKIALGVENSANLDSFGSDIENGSKKYSDISSVISSFKLKDIVSDKGLTSINSNIAKAVKHVDDNYNGRFDYTKGDLGETKVNSDGTLEVKDLKATNGRSKNVSRAGENSEEAKTISTLYKYVDTQSKK